jgi:hypothetical protein
MAPFGVSEMIAFFFTVKEEPKADTVLLTLNPLLSLLIQIRNLIWNKDMTLDILNEESLKHGTTTALTKLSLCFETVQSCSSTILAEYHLRNHTPHAKSFGQECVFRSFFFPFLCLNLFFFSTVRFYEWNHLHASAT